MKINTLLLPKYDNLGTNLKPVYKIMKRRLLEEFGGLTESTVNGSWIDDDGKIYDDECIKFEIACDISITKERAFKSLVKEAGILAGQLAMFYTWNTQAFIMDIKDVAIAS